MLSSKILTGPQKLSAFHYKHIALKAKFIENAERWVMPEQYIDPETEMNRVLSGVGICDISPIGKIDLKGAGIDSFLGRNYPNSSIPLEPGRVMKIEIARSGDPNIFLPVTYVCRLAKDHALILGDDRGRKDAVSSVLETGNKWVSKLDEKTYLTDVSSVYAGLLLTGPLSMEVLAKVTKFDAFAANGLTSSVTCAQTGLAKIHAIIVQDHRPQNAHPTILPFFHLYFGREYAEYIWDAITDAGEEFGLIPFGFRAMQEILDRSRTESNKFVS